jgi:hypothetical protein
VTCDRCRRWSQRYWTLGDAVFTCFITQVVCWMAYNADLCNYVWSFSNPSACLILMNFVDFDNLLGIFRALVVASSTRFLARDVGWITWDAKRRNKKGSICEISTSSLYAQIREDFYQWRSIFAYRISNRRRQDGCWCRGQQFRCPCNWSFCGA